MTKTATISTALTAEALTATDLMLKDSIIVVEMLKGTIETVLELTDLTGKDTTDTDMIGPGIIMMGSIVRDAHARNIKIV